MYGHDFPKLYHPITHNDLLTVEKLPKQDLGNVVYHQALTVKTFKTYGRHDSNIHLYQNIHYHQHHCYHYRQYPDPDFGLTDHFYNFNIFCLLVYWKET